MAIATYNRAEQLRQTLSAMESPGRQDIPYEFVIVNSNGNDDALEVVRELASSLSITFLDQRRPGKNAAMNMALDTANLGRVVVFTDDDVVPQEDWLVRILEVTDRNPLFSIFGGRVDLPWPPDYRPSPWGRTL